MNMHWENEFVKRLKEKIADREKVILNGIENPLENSQTIGYRKGLLAALDIFNELQKAAENE